VAQEVLVEVGELDGAVGADGQADVGVSARILERLVGAERPVGRGQEVQLRLRERVAAAELPRQRAAAAGAPGDDGNAGAPPVSIEKRAKGDLGQLLSRAQGESVQAAVISGSNPIECEVYIDNELAGYYKGRDPGHLERNIKYRLEEVGKKVDLRVEPVNKAGGPEQAPESAEQPGDTAPAGPSPDSLAEPEPSSSPQG
jgi:hypothetical protein